eukprot:1161025-Pelagomonas_calceolata.AAC.10
MICGSYINAACCNSQLQSLLEATLSNTQGYKCLAMKAHIHLWRVQTTFPISGHITAAKARTSSIRNNRREAHENAKQSCICISSALQA